MRNIVSCIVAALCVSGCIGMAMAPVHVANLKATPPSLMVAKKAALPLYIVLDPAKVPDTYKIPGDELKPVDVFELQMFVKRDLKNTMETFFQKVEIVAPGAVPPKAPCWVADVRIDKVAMSVNKATDTTARYVAAQIFGQLTWAFAIRSSKADEYAYSFAGTSVGTYSLTHVSETGKAMESAFEQALSSMIKGMIDKGVDKTLIATTAAGG